MSNPTAVKHCSLNWKLATPPKLVDSGLELDDAEPSTSSVSSTKPAAAFKYSKETYHIKKNELKHFNIIYIMYLNKH